MAEISGKFDSGIWYRLSLGHKHRADPKWLLPMICKAGNVTKKDVGAIKIYQNETHFEIAGGEAENYASTVREKGTGERNVTIDLIDLRGARPRRPRKTLAVVETSGIARAAASAVADASRRRSAAMTTRPRAVKTGSTVTGRTRASGRAPSPHRVAASAGSTTMKPRRTIRPTRLST